MSSPLASIAAKAWMSLHQLGAMTRALHRAQELADKERDDNTLLELLNGDGGSESLYRP